MKLWQQQAAFAQDVSRLISFISQEGYHCTFGESYRTPEQAAIYAQENKGIKNSLHCERLAVDLNLFNNNGDYLIKTETYEPFGKYWESLNPQNVWGGNFTRGDGCHFERKKI